ncbi:unnamed protein product [Triticum turgidum subsp. durum]|uniref:Uncharacterized protein n=1 Tax=Triticum turgidum subsp. durum TaxID=4567 RepID=A0A9R0QLN6_TRITD|nr:unnamed protein product [Triticum turgidum subsp. durum]
MNRNIIIILVVYLPHTPIDSSIYLLNLQRLRCKNKSALPRVLQFLRLRTQSSVFTSAISTCTTQNSLVISAPSSSNLGSQLTTLARATCVMIF